MSGAKRLAGSLLGLLVALILLMLALRLMGKVPFVGPIANDARNLASAGSLSGN